MSASRRAQLEWAIVVALVLAALAWTAVNLLASGRAWAAVTPPARLVEDWRTFIRPEERLLAQNGRVVVVAFSDFQCAVCGAFHDAVRPVEQDPRQRVVVLWRHLPLRTHPQAAPAARAAVCAADQGGGEQMRVLLFSAVDSLGQVPWMELARRAGIADTARYAACLKSAATERRLDADYEDADRLGTLSTPTLLIGNKLYRGMPADLLRILDREKGG